MDVSLYFCGHKYFDYELYMNKYGSNYHIRMDLNILVCHYNYLTFDHCHYLILVFTCKYVYDYTLNIVNTHSFCLIHSPTRYRMERLCSVSTFQPNIK
jgi:hypothetical protein